MILWLPFIIHSSSILGIHISNSDFKYIEGNYDGPLYVIPAKTWYDPAKIDIPGKGLIISLPLSAGYFAAHLPLYPFFISITALFTNYLKALVFTNVFFSAFLVVFFYFFLKKFNLSKNPLLLAVIFSFLPRFFVVRSVGAPESLFMLLILSSLYFFEKKKYLLAGLIGALSAATKTPGVLLFIAYVLVFAEYYWKTKKFELRWLWTTLIPFGLLAVFTLYSFTYHDFFAYFHTGGVVPLLYPFAAFNFQAKWVGSAWLEDIFFYFFMYAYTIFALHKIKYRSLFYFGIVFFIASVFVQHRDIARYSLPLWPLACIALDQFLTSKKSFYTFLLLLPAVYLYAWNFIVFNIMPIADWKPFL